MKRFVASVAGVVCVVPFLLILMLSFARRWEYPNVLPRDWSAAAWTSGRGTLETFAYSVFLSMTVALLSTVMSFLAARTIAWSRRRGTLLIMAYVPYVISPVIFAVCLLYFDLRLGIDGTFLGVVLAQTVLASGFATIFFVDFWSEEKKALQDLVATLGGNTFQLYRRVFLPLSREPLLLCFFQCFLISWYQYGLTVLIGEGKVRTLSLAVFDYVSEANPAYAAMSSCLLVLPPVFLLWVNRRIMRRTA